MDPSFVQNVSRQTVEPYGFEHHTFTNMSSQQMNPGELPSYFDASETTGYMPFAQANLPVSHAPIESIVNEKNNVSNLSRVPGNEELFYKKNLVNKNVPVRTPTARAWNVPLSLVELRATDANF
jgi:hypothetical protein